MDSLEGYVSDDDLAIGPLQDRGWDVSTVSWRNRSVDWNDFDIVVLRTTWDYQNQPDEFLSVLRAIDSSKARLENPLSLVEWNLDKRYLGDLERRGIPVVPTLWGNGRFSELELAEWQNAFGVTELILKPTVSATAQNTFRVHSYDPNIAHVFNGRSYMAQPFIRSIVNEGEYSVFYFNGIFSHAILKTPMSGDFRVQEEHGGIISSVNPTSSLLEAAAKITELIDPLPLYARIDLVRHDEAWCVMELELIEPALYFRMDPNSPRLFARELDRRMNEL